MKRLKILILIAMLPLSNCVLANQEGEEKKEPILSGSVSDANSRKPVKGVTISISSSKDKKAQKVTTDAAGQFMIPMLPAGEVTIILEKKGYKTYRKEKIILKEGAPVKLKVDLSYDADSEDACLFQPLLRMMES